MWSGASGTSVEGRANTGIDYTNSFTTVLNLLCPPTCKTHSRTNVHGVGKTATLLVSNRHARIKYTILYTGIYGQWAAKMDLP